MKSSVLGCTLSVVGMLVSGCVNLLGWDYVPTDQNYGNMSLATAREIIQRDLLYDPGDGKPVDLGGMPITKVRISTQRLVISTADSSAVVMLKDIKPGVHRADAVGVGAVVSINDNTGLKVHSDDQPGFSIGIANALYVLKKNAIISEAENSSMDFEGVVASYRSAEVKPSLPEEARKARIQAEGAVRDKDFHSAADLYGRAVNIAPWWPEGHFNRALVLGEIEDYELAIVEMKKYLALVPDAPNARAAQDKIYDWERKAGN